ncbi:MAG: alpha/beta fold hydrolase [Immundisolibacter sp.]|uniref:alpha/beta fold hydrolase n=1 Tax=Immundisolibacter sp. TaxID=1934948 RepID=UPI003EE20AE6
MAAVEEHHIKLSCGDNRYLEAGDGPPLLLVHGMGVATSANSVEMLIPHLAPRFRVLAPDLLGFGLGTRQVEAGPTFDLILEQLREFMDRLGLAQVHWVGHSLGGWLGGLFAYQSPQRLGRLVMLCGAGLNREPAPGVGARLQPSREQLRELVRGWLSDPGRLSTTELERVVDGMRAAAAAPGAADSLDALLAQMQSVAVRERYMLHRRMPYISVPVLMAWGEHDALDPYPTWSAEFDALGRDMHRSSKPWAPAGARFAKLPCGHHPQWELPQQAAALAGDFLLGS